MVRATHAVYNTAGDREAPYLVLRSGASRHDRAIGHLVDGTQVRRLGEERHSRGTWYQIEVLSGTYRGRTGWAHSNWLDEVDSR